MQTKKLFVLACLLVCVSSTCYVSPFGSDNNPGTQEAPFQTIGRGVSYSSTVILMPGAYSGAGNYNVNIQRSVNITAQPNVFVACPDLSYSAFYSNYPATISITLSGFTIRDCASGFRTQGSSSSRLSLYVQGMTFSSVTQGILASYLPNFNLTIDSSNFTTVDYGILQENSNSYNTIRGSKFQGVSKNAINVPTCLAQMKILNTNFTETKDSAILTQCSLNVTNSSFSLLNAVNGSAILVESSVAIHITGSNFSNNTAQLNGGAISVSRASVVITSSKFVSNSALANGGAIYVESGANVALGQSSLYGNMAGSNGGGAYSEGTLNIAQSNFNANVAKAAGGGFYCANGLNFVSDSTFTSNSAATGPAYGCNGCTTYASNNQFTGSGTGTACPLSKGLAPSF